MLNEYQIHMRDDVEKVAEGYLATLDHCKTTKPKGDKAKFCGARLVRSMVTTLQ